MRKIILVGAAPIGDTFRYPSEGPIEIGTGEGQVDPAVAQAWIDAGLAVGDDLEKLKVEDLTQIAAEESVFIPEGAKKADIIDAIRSHRTGSDG